MISSPSQNATPEIFGLPVVAIPQRIEPGPASEAGPITVATSDEQRPDPRLAKIHSVPADWLDLSKSPPARPQLVTFRGEGFLPRGKVAVVAGPGGVGKSQLLVQLACAVACDRPWLEEFKIESPGRVALLLAEEDDDELHRRIRGVVSSLVLGTASEKDIVRNLFVGGFAGETVAMLDGGKPWETITRTDWVDVLWNHLAESGTWSLIVLDPMSRWNGGPNQDADSARATEFIQITERFAQLPGSPAVVVAAHVAKGTGKDPQTTPRGPAALQDAARWVATLTEKPCGSIAFTVTKSNYGRRPPAVLLSRGAGGYLHFSTTAEDEKSVSLDVRILRALAGGPRKISLLKDELGRSAKDINKRLEPLLAEGTIVKDRKTGEFRLAEATAQMEIAPARDGGR